MVQWLRLHAPNARGPGFIPGQGTRSHMPHGMAKRIIIKIIGEFVNNWKSNSTLLNNPLVKEKISKEIRKYRLEQK